MSSSGTITVCINSGPTMKKNEPVIGGQFWQQENRSMSAVNGVIPGTPNTRESVIRESVILESVILAAEVSRVDVMEEQRADFARFHPHWMYVVADDYQSRVWLPEICE
jgi:hypothetical protein